MTKTAIILSIFSLLLFEKSAAQDSDSTKVTRIVEDFYEWYVKAIDERNLSAYSPKFVESEDGNTTLDYSEYMENLTRLSFSEELIKEERETYKKCIGNLLKVKYSEFDSIYSDLDDYEMSGCDFNNYYRWFGGIMEPVDGIKITEVIVDLNEAEVKFKYYNYHHKDNTYYYWTNTTSVHLLKTNDKWEINKIK